MPPRQEITVASAQDLGDESREAISSILVEGFYQWLQYFSKDKSQLTQAFRHMFLLEYFYAALLNGEIAGIAACTDGQTPCVKIQTKEFRRHLGWFRGSIAGFFLKREFERHAYPFEMPAEGKTCSVEFVATAPKFRGQGVATSIIQHFFTFPQYDQYVLEVADTNTPAVNLYESLGFREFVRIKMKNAKRSGIHFLVYMQYWKQPQHHPPQNP